MKIDFEFSSTVFVHDILNPPAARRGSDITLEISNNRELNLLKKPIAEVIQGPARTSYDLNIVNPFSIGFTTSETSKFAEEFKNLILALNLSLSRSCVTETNFMFGSPKFQFKPMNLRNDVRKIGNRVHAFTKDVVIVSDDSFAYVSLSDEVDELHVLDLFRIIQQFRTNDIEGNRFHTNLTKAINEYEKGMVENSSPFIFKHLFNALELSTNCFVEYPYESFGKIVSKNSGISEETVSEWRNFYNRIKHVDKSEKHRTAYLEGINQVNSMILPIRTCTKKSIIGLLTSTQMQA